MTQENNYLTIKVNGSHELTIKKSRFIATLIRTTSIAEAETAIGLIKQKYRDASHNTFAYTIGLNDEHVKASDNGEPAGTAGVPELKALQLMNLKNVTVVVTRYFGGVKLGAGGLIRAYANSVTKGVEAIGVVKRVLQQELIFHVPYNHFDEVQHFLATEQFLVDHIDYGTDVVLHVYTDSQKQKQLADQLTNLLAGKVQFKVGIKRYNELPIIDHNYHSH
ncbi:YigZ family protein [Lactobacillus xylocopicola]|uniref:YigZ family protein n=1 Tax=Lactobacillus xylocopicola TaxID=2976676 RepID=A0ABN6SIU7_9LACO|nr:YigZ family protein [Lactobacillus xylocopicola]BDR60240.1 YigZ family protein [Lactobacillus xylocopicola]